MHYAAMMFRLRALNALLVGALLLAGTPRVHAQEAQSVLLAFDDEVSPALVERLRSEFGLRALSVAVAAPLREETAEARLLEAQTRAAQAHARALLWMERGREVHAVSTDGLHRYALLPRATRSIAPRVFAVIAVSAFDELNFVVEDQPAAGESEPSEVPEASTESAPTVAAPTEVTPAEQSEPSEVAPVVDAPIALEASQVLELANPVDARPISLDRNVRNGDVHSYFALDGLVGAVWAFNTRDNIAHIVQRFTGGVQWRLFRGEFSGSLGLEHGMDGSYARSAIGDLMFFVGAGIPMGDISLDVGGLGGLVLNGLSDASSPVSKVLTSGRLGAGIGLSTPDAHSALIFRLRLELGLFARIDPGVATLFTNVFVGIGFR